MDWDSVDGRLIKRGELLLSLEFLDRYEKELRAMNRCKEGRPFTLTDSHIVFLAIGRCPKKPKERQPAKCSAS